jgi:hypothetical protein
MEDIKISNWAGDEWLAWPYSIWAYEYLQLWVSSCLVNNAPSKSKGNRQTASPDHEQHIANSDAILRERCYRDLDRATLQMDRRQRPFDLAKDLSIWRLWIDGL